MRTSWRAAGLLIAAVYLAWMAPAAAEDKIALCHAGLIKLAPFAQHIKELRKQKRYEAADIDKLIAQARKGGAEFFTSQIIVQEEQTGSGTFDLRLFHGLSERGELSQRRRPGPARRTTIRSLISSASGCAKSRTARSSSRARKTCST